MINSREKGKRFELDIAKRWMRLFGGEVDRTSYASKKMDDAGVDLTNTDPFYLQCKAVEQSLDIHAILDRMPHDGHYNVVIHKRNNRGIIAALYLEDFEELLQAMRNERII